MTDQEKAWEIAESCYSKRTKDKPANKLGQTIIMQACMKMAAWKDQQAEEYLYNQLQDGMIDCRDMETFIKGFKS